MKSYLSLFRIRFSARLQYRAAAAAGVVTQFAWGFMELLAYSAFYRANPSAFPMEFSQTVSYIWIQQAFLAFFNSWFFDNDIFTAIESGSIAYEIVRPMDLYNRWFCQNVANRLSSSALRCFPILIVAFLVPAPLRMSLPESAVRFMVFLLSMALAMCVVVAFSMIVYITTFFTLSPRGVRIAASILADFLAGSIIPLPFFPNGFRQVAELLPFAAMQNMPLRIYSGNIAGNDAINGLLLQVFWFAALCFLGRAMMKRALSRVVVQGG